jgi:hypothetical protein
MNSPISIINIFNTTLNKWIEEMLITINKLKNINETEKQKLINKVSTIKDAFQLMTSSNEKNTKPLEIFMQHVSPVKDFIRNRDPQIWKNKPPQPCILFLSEFGIDKYWDLLPEKSKKGMWDFMDMLIKWGDLYQIIPKEHMAQVETMANQLFANLTKNK